MRMTMDWLTRDQARRVDAWLVANGCRHHVSLDHPVIVKGHGSTQVMRVAEVTEGPHARQIVKLYSSR